MNRLITVLAAVVFLAMGGTKAVVAHEGHDHKIMGTVTMAAVDHVMVKDKSGKDVTVKVSKETKVKATPAMRAQDIKAGTRVVITAQEAKDKSMMASVIEVGVKADTDGHADHGSGK